MWQPKPYFKKPHKAWYANIGPNKRPVKPGTDEEAAWKEYHT